jgi:hypothetical protein
VSVSQYVLSKQALQGGVGVNVYFDAVTSDGAELGLPSTGEGRKIADRRLLEESVAYLVEAIERMTGVRPTTSNDIRTSGVVVAIGRGAVAAAIPIGNPAIDAYLSEPNLRQFERRSRYVVASFSGRVVVAADAVQGASAGIVAMLEAVGYEVLGMGPNWTYVPDFRRLGRMRFLLEEYGQPSLLFRQFGATSRQDDGVGTLVSPTFAPVAPDETVTTSYRRWLVGTRTAGSSLPPFYGHALPVFGPKIATRIRASVALGAPVLEGFLGVVRAGPGDGRPVDLSAEPQLVYVSTTINSGASPAVFTPTKVANADPGPPPVPERWEWVQSGENAVAAEIDVSLPWVRDMIFEDFKTKAADHFADPYNVNEPFVYGVDPDDGLGLLRLNRAKHKVWYEEEMVALNRVFGAYRLHGLFGIDQPTEVWEIENPSDTAFGLANWLLWKYDAYIGNQMSGGVLQRDLVRCELQCYALHDVPPTFNLDERTQILVSEAFSFYNRGVGRWRELRSAADAAKAFRAMVPGIVLADYTIPTQAASGDQTVDALIPPRFASTDLDDLRRRYGPESLADFDGSLSESDFNFGRFGPFYYLGAKLLWNQQLTTADLEQLRDRWILRAFGQEASGVMRAYFNRRSPQELTYPGPREWGACARYIDEAIRRTPAGKEHELNRLWDFAQYWYAYALIDVATNGLTQVQKDDALARLEEFMWKGQMAYTVAMYPIAKRFFDSYDIAAITRRATPNSDTAHYTVVERTAWWRWTLLHWTAPTVHTFTSGKLSNGTQIRPEDLNDLVAPRAFAAHQISPQARGFAYNGPGELRPLRFVCTGRRGQTIGAKIYWRTDSTIAPAFRVERWNGAGRWDVLIRRAAGTQLNAVVAADGRDRYECVVTYPVTVKGTYRFTVYSSAFEVVVTQLSYDVAAGTVGTIAPLCFAEDLASGYTQTAYMYIPKGTRSLDFDYWAQDTHRWRFRIYRSLLPSPLTLAFDQIIGDEVLRAGCPPPGPRDRYLKRGTHSILLPAGTDGTVMELEANGFEMPLFHSIPMLSAKAPDQLLVPTKIAIADGLVRPPSVPFV